MKRVGFQKSAMGSDAKIHPATAVCTGVRVTS
jgi:hypothetical protein